MYDYCFIRKNDTKGGVTAEYPATSKLYPRKSWIHGYTVIPFMHFSTLSGFKNDK